MWHTIYFNIFECSSIPQELGGLTQTQMFLCTKQGLTWFAKFEVDYLKWPAQIPDLNFNEHLWDGLECQLHPRRV